MAAIPQFEDYTGAEPGTIRVADYLAGEDSAELRSEYLGGLVYAMTGASVRHNRIVGNTFAALRSRVPAGCEVFFESVKLHLRLQGLDWFYYPDAMVCCDPVDDHPLYRERPCLLVEVLSESPARIDRREKYLAYTQIDSLLGYLLLDQASPHARLFRRAGEGGWQEESFDDPAAVLDLPCAGAVPLAELYAGLHIG